MTNEHAPSTAHDNPGEPHDPTRSADGQTARRLTNTSGEYTIERARDSFRKPVLSGHNPESGRGGGGNGALMLLCGIGLGAALMYLLDPQHGGRRREQLGESLAGLSDRTTDLAGRTTRELRERAQGVVSQAGGLFRRQGDEAGGGSGGQQQSEGGGSEAASAASAGATGAGTSGV